LVSDAFADISTERLGKQTVNGFHCQTIYID